LIPRASSHVLHERRIVIAIVIALLVTAAGVIAAVTLPY
jgi:hypothetical protein